MTWWRQILWWWWPSTDVGIQGLSGSGDSPIWCRSRAHFNLGSAKKRRYILIQLKIARNFRPPESTHAGAAQFWPFCTICTNWQRTSPENGFIRSKHSLQVQIQLTNVLKIWKMFDIAQANLTVPVYWWNMIRLQDYQKLFVSRSTLRFSISYRCGRGP